MDRNLGLNYWKVVAFLERRPGTLLAGAQVLDRKHLGPGQTACRDDALSGRTF